MSSETANMKFPQMPRFFSATTFRKALTITSKILLWGALALIVGVNAGLDQLVSTVTSKNQDILGAQHQTTPTPKMENSLESEYQYWLTIVSDHPDYRDGFVRLATLAYQLGDRDKSREYLEKIRTLDPNYEGIRALEALLQTR